VLRFYPEGNGGPWEAFKQGSDSLKTPVLNISQLAGKVLNIQRRFMGLRRAFRS
jgi:hypothetical protein